jgi:hypothetical protein
VPDPPIPPQDTQQDRDNLIKLALADKENKNKLALADKENRTRIIISGLYLVAFVIAAIVYSVKDKKCLELLSKEILRVLTEHFTIKRAMTPAPVSFTSAARHTQSLGW